MVDLNIRPCNAMGGGLIMSEGRCNLFSWHAGYMKRLLRSSRMCSIACLSAAEVTRHKQGVLPGAVTAVNLFIKYKHRV